jgi:hypothetical protein
VKIGEGTYGEAFKSGQFVLKFVPMEGSNLINGWAQKGAGDLLGEAIIARALTDLGQDEDETGARMLRQLGSRLCSHRPRSKKTPQNSRLYPRFTGDKLLKSSHHPQRQPLIHLPVLLAGGTALAQPTTSTPHACLQPAGA